LSDAELYQQIRLGDGQALAQVYDRYVSKVYAIARRLTTDREMIEEIVQDVFTRVWTTQGYDPAVGEFSHWLGVVAKRIAIDHLRKQNRMQKSGVALAIEDQPIPDPKSSEGEALSRLMRADLRKALSGLRPEERLIMELAYFQGYTLSEVASTLEMPLGTVKTRLHAGLVRLRTSLADWQMEVHG